jgi:hypothetical protein
MLHISPVSRSPGGSGMGSPSSSAEHTPAAADHRPVDAEAEPGVASSLPVACSTSAPATRSRMYPQT